jgi:hypothetical protein
MMWKTLLAVDDAQWGDAQSSDAQWGDAQSGDAQSGDAQWDNAQSGEASYRSSAANRPEAEISLAAIALFTASIRETAFSLAKILRTCRFTVASVKCSRPAIWAFVIAAATRVSTSISRFDSVVSAPAPVSVCGETESTILLGSR